MPGAGCEISQSPGPCHHRVPVRFLPSHPSISQALALDPSDHLLAVTWGGAPHVASTTCSPGISAHAQWPKVGQWAGCYQGAESGGPGKSSLGHVPQGRSHTFPSLPHNEECSEVSLEHICLAQRATGNLPRLCDNLPFSRPDREQSLPESQHRGFKVVLTNRGLACQISLPPVPSCPSHSLLTLNSPSPSGAPLLPSPGPWQAHTQEAILLPEASRSWSKGGAERPRGGGLWPPSKLESLPSALARSPADPSQDWSTPRGRSRSEGSKTRSCHPQQLDPG